MKGSTFCPKRKTLAAAGALLFWLAVWQLAHLAVGRDYLLASPVQTLQRMLRLMGEAVFWRSAGATMLRVLAGFFSAMGLGALLAFFSLVSPLVKTLFAPLLGAVRATPVVSFVLLALVWMRAGSLPVFIAFLMVLPLSYTNILSGLESLDRQLLEMARVFGFSRRRTLRLIYLPSLTPYIAAACASGLGFAWKSAIAAEVIAHPALGVGRRIHQAKIYFEIPDLFAWTAGVILISIGLEKVALRALGAVERRLPRLGGGGFPHG